MKAAYGLWVTAAEHDAIAAILSGCPNEPAATVAAPPADATLTTPPGPAATTGGDVYYANCAAVRAAGRAPLDRGEPGYRAGLDGDSDGVACE